MGGNSKNQELGNENTPRFFNRILKMIENHNTQVYYLRGNHDDFLDQILPLQIGNLSIQTDMIYESQGKKILHHPWGCFR